MTAKLDRLPEPGSFYWFGEGKHIVKVSEVNGGFNCICDCGAQWRISPMKTPKATLAEVNYTYVGHIGYDKKAPTTIL